MIRALLQVRFRSLFSGFVKHQKKKSIGTTILFIFLYLYLAVVMCGMMSMVFLSLAEPYHAMGLDWLYFAMAGLLALGFSVIGSVFSTQSQLYDAKDNAFLLSLPIPPKLILLSRMIPLLVLNLLYSGIVFLPAMVVYAIQIGFRAGDFLLQLVSLFGICVLSQTVACLFGWLLHLMLQKMNKSLASLVYMILFLGIYFYVYSHANSLLTAIAENGAAIAKALHSAVWPIYALGMGCTGLVGYFLAFLCVCALCFLAAYSVLSATFLHSVTAAPAARRKRSVRARSNASFSPLNTIVNKEWRKFIGCPVYLTNMGLGIIFTVVMPVACFLFRGKLILLMIDPQLNIFFRSYMPLLICAASCYLGSMSCISTPSVSLEGKNIWILKSLPIPAEQILKAKLKFHCLLTVPTGMAAGLLLALMLGCGIADCLLCGLIPGLVALFNGVLGLVTGLRWAKLDYISEAYPCKQSISVLVTMFSTMGLPLILGLLYAFVLADYLSATLFLLLAALLLALLVYGLYQLLLRYGVRKWEQLA